MLFYYMFAAVALAVLSQPILKGARLTMEFINSMGGSERFESNIDKYNKLQNDDATTLKEREQNYAQLVNQYYDLATEFYEWGWGQSFHFADRRRNETFHSSILRHEYYLAGRLALSKGSKVLDCGCGVGGPARNIAQFTNSHVTGITINDFQVKRGNALCQQQGLADRVKIVQGDFMKMPFKDSTFDAVYAIEATCHAPDRVGVYSEIFRVLKPGGIFATYEWCLTDSYDKSNEEHRAIKKSIEEGDGLPDMCHTSVCTKSLEKSGFTVVEARDAALDGHKGGDPWYRPLSPSWKPWQWPRFQFNPVMFTVFPYILKAFELCRIVPKGTTETQVMLQKGGVGCERGGALGIFTPMWLMVAQKPAKTKAN